MNHMKLSRQKVRAFETHIFAWWSENRRDLPWRHTRDPYKILVSEVMLQQTQVIRVIPKYTEFIEAFPDIRVLAKASPARVLKIWKGMGYNRRALYLRKTAEVVVASYHDKFPKDEVLLTKLPGVGTYTARALMVFAYGMNVAMVDTNIRQIITHFFFSGRTQKEKTIQTVADQLVPKGKSWEWHQALMDYGALAMTKQKKTMRLVKKQKPFKDSDRYYRGRIVDLLRLGRLNEKKLITDFMNQYSKERVFFAGIVEGLIRDGLVERRNGYVSLPD